MYMNNKTFCNIKIGDILKVEKSFATNKLGKLTLSKNAHSTYDNKCYLIVKSVEYLDNGYIKFKCFVSEEYDKQDIDRTSFAIKNKPNFRSYFATRTFILSKDDFNTIFYI